MQKGNTPMISAHELRQILHNLIEEWPGDDSHPTVRQAQEFLSSHRSYGSMELADDQNEDYQTALWYSI